MVVETGKKGEGSSLVLDVSGQWKSVLVINRGARYDFKDFG